ncbi:MAG: ABC transporter substrate-binding protein [Lachnospiraceae bacterium]|nr:ABC transporter substrate-binding protein [Lachnospiraceae bacterium]
MKKKIAALLSAAMLASVIFTACAGAAPAAAPAPEAAAEEAAPAAEAEAPAAEEAAPAEEAAAPEFDEITTIKVTLFDTRGVGEVAGPVFDAMNAITEQKIGVHADITMKSLAEYSTQLGLQLASGEQLDVISLGFGATSFSSLVANGQLMDITDLIQEEAPETYAEVGEYLKVDSMGGRIYGIPPYRNYVSSSYMTMRKDILEELGMLDQALSMTSWDQVEELFATVAEKTDLIPTGSGKNILWSGGYIFPGGDFADTITFDTLSDPVGVIFADEETNQLSLLLENPNYRAEQEMIRDWYNKGWVYKDSPYEDNTSEIMIKTNVSFAMFGTSEFGIETAKTEAIGKEMVSLELASKPLATANVANFGLGIPVNAEEPEAGMRWINELYTNPDMINLMFWGIEGENYVVEDGQAKYPDGVEPDKVGYHSVDFLYGNYFLGLPWIGSGADFRQQAKAILDAGELSPYFGFRANADNVVNIISALSAITEQYNGSIRCGAFTDELYDEYIASLKANGVDDYIADYQKQLDEWLAANN